MACARQMTLTAKYERIPAVSASSSYNFPLGPPTHVSLWKMICLPLLREAHRAIAQYVHGFYHPVRLHSSLGDSSPNEYAQNAIDFKIAQIAAEDFSE